MYENKPFNDCSLNCALQCAKYGGEIYVGLNLHTAILRLIF